MAIVLPLMAGVLLVCLHGRRDGRWREAILRATIAWALLVVLCTEGASSVERLTHGVVAAFWAAVLAVTGAACWAMWRRRRFASGTRAGGEGDENAAAATRQRLPRGQKALLAGIAVIAATLLLIALAAAPNNFDSMTYHMARVWFWMQNHTTAYYPTHISRQVEFPPLAEYIILQFQILSGGDRFANLVQWLAMVGTAIAASVIAARLGAGTKGQVLAALVSATIPIGILEATSTQNDYVAAYWTLCAVACLMDLGGQASGDGRSLREGRTWRDRRTWRDAAYFGAALGLAMLTKGTTAIFAWPVVLVLCVVALRRRGWPSLAPLAMAGCFAIALAAPTYWRNYRVFGDATGSPQQHQVIENGKLRPWIMASNALRNGAVALTTPSPWINQHLLYEPVVCIHRWLGWDPSATISTTDPPIPFFVRWDQIHEDQLGSGVHLLLLLAFLLTAAFMPALRRRPLVLALAGALVASYLTFCLLINWQPWHGRHFLVLLALWAPLLGIFLEALPEAIGYGVAIAMLLLAVPLTLFNASRPLLGAHSVLTTPREQQYFANWPAMWEPYRRTADSLAARGTRQLGLLSGWDSYTYPLLVMLQHRLGPGLRVDYSNDFRYPIHGRVRVPARERPAPNTLVILKFWDWYQVLYSPLELDESGGTRRYGLAADFGPIAVFQTPAPVSEDKVFFRRGWCGLTQTPHGWGNWSWGTGLFVLQRRAAGDMDLAGTVMSGPIPNELTVKVNGQPAGRIPIQGNDREPFGPLRLHLQAGQNVVEVTSRAPAAHFDAEPHERAFMLGDLRLRDAPGRTMPLEPVQAP